MKKTIITFLLALVFPITASAQLESVKEYRRHKKCGGYKKSKMKCLQMTFEIINVVQHAFLIKKGTMKYSLVIIFAMSLLAACSNNDEITVTPDHPHTYRNTGKLLSMDGGNEHLAFSYDSEGRVVFAERVDSGSFLVKQQADYLYDNDCIYVTFREFAQLPNGEHDSNYTRDFCHYDTLFLANGRVDSLAGHRPSSRHVQAIRFFFKFHYNEQGQLISIRNDNFNYIYQDKINETPWYTELYTLEWQDGNITRRTCTIPQQKKTMIWNYCYSELVGTMPYSDPRVILFDLMPLFSTGFFGFEPYNLPLSIESDEYKKQIGYLLDEQQMVFHVKSTVTLSDGLPQLYDYQIKWQSSSVH